MTQTIHYENNLAIVELSGSITSSNAGEFEAIMANEPGEHDGIIIDAKALEYISSAGLRVILSAKKRCGEKTFKVINANDEVMNVFEVTGFCEIMDITKALRHVSVENCERIGAGACGEVFRLDDETIVKLYFPRIKNEEIEQEKALAKKAFVMGVPTAISYDIVDVDGRIGVIYELINSKTITELIREDEDNLEEYVNMHADMCRHIHSIEAKEGELPFFKDLNRADIPNVSGISEEEREYLYEFIDMVPDRLTCVHGDINPNNIMVQNGECCLIDMGEFSTGTAMFDISRLLFSMEFAMSDADEFNDFYKLSNKTVRRFWELFIKRYFRADTLDEAAESNPDVSWLYPLAWFRCVTSMMKGDRWPVEKREMAGKLLREKLIPFVVEHRNK